MEVIVISDKNSLFRRYGQFRTTRRRRVCSWNRRGNDRLVLPRGYSEGIRAFLLKNITPPSSAWLAFSSWSTWKMISGCSATVHKSGRAEVVLKQTYLWTLRFCNFLGECPSRKACHPPQGDDFPWINNSQLLLVGDEWLLRIRTKSKSALISSRDAWRNCKLGNFHFSWAKQIASASLLIPKNWRSGLSLANREFTWPYPSPISRTFPVRGKT